MTSNQIAYANLQETNRHNLQTEEVDRRNATVNERNATTNWYQYMENVRHNKASESIGYMQASAALSQAAAAHNRNSIQRENNLWNARIGAVNAKTNRMQAATADWRAKAENIRGYTQMGVDIAKTFSAARAGAR